MRKHIISASILAVTISLWTGTVSAQTSSDPHQHDQAAADTSGSQNQDPMMQMMSGMMGMMRNMHGQSGMGMCGMGANDRIEGRLAFLHAELQITAAQEPAWKKLADVLRENSKKAKAMRAGSMQMQETDLAARTELEAKRLQARADELTAVSNALKPLLQSFSPEQKKSADELLTQHFGVMMPGMMRGQMMGGQMMGGQMMGGGMSDMPGMSGGSQQTGQTSP